MTHEKLSDPHARMDDMTTMPRPAAHYKALTFQRYAWVWLWGGWACAVLGEVAYLSENPRFMLVPYVVFGVMVAFFLAAGVCKVASVRMERRATASSLGGRA